MSKAKKKLVEELEVSIEEVSEVETEDTFNPEEGIKLAQSGFMDWKSGTETSENGSGKVILGLYELAIFDQEINLELREYLNILTDGEKKQKNQAYEEVFNRYLGVKDFKSVSSNEKTKLKQVLPIVLYMVDSQNDFDKPVIKIDSGKVKVRTELAFDTNTDAGKAKVESLREYSPLNGYIVSAKNLNKMARDYLGIESKGSDDKRNDDKAPSRLQCITHLRAHIKNAEDTPSESEIELTLKLIAELEQWIDDSLNELEANGKLHNNKKKKAA